MTDDLAAYAALVEQAGDVPQDQPGLSTPRVRVTLDTGEVLEAQVRNPDYIRWDRTAAKHGWPSMAKVPVTWLTFVAWSALRREGLIPDALTWEDFSETRAIGVETVTPPPAEAGHRNGTAPTADPTLPGVGPG